MMAQSVTLESLPVQLPETWRRFYNGPHFGLIDIEIAKREMPWLVGLGSGVTLNTDPIMCSTALDANQSR